MAYCTRPLDFTPQEQFDAHLFASQEYTFYNPEMPIYDHSPPLVGTPAATDIATTMAYNAAGFPMQWHLPQQAQLQVPNAAKSARPLGPNGKPKRRRVATVSQRRAANVRERRRMFNLNESFDTLRTKVPTFAYEKRLSRIETLRLAITYISFLTDLIDGKDPEEVRLLNVPKNSENTRMKRTMEKETDLVYYDDESDNSSQM